MEVLKIQPAPEGFLELGKKNLIIGQIFLVLDWARNILVHQFFMKKRAEEVTQKIISIDGSDAVQRLIISFSESTDNDFKLWVWWGVVCLPERQSNPLIHFLKMCLPLKVTKSLTVSYMMNRFVYFSKVPCGPLLYTKCICKVTKVWLSFILFLEGN